MVNKTKERDSNQSLSFCFIGWSNRPLFSSQSSVRGRKEGKLNSEFIEVAKLLKIRTNMDEKEYNYFLSHYSVNELKEIFKDILK